ncbi:ATP-binding protein [Streptomyces sp. NRRL WC-3742]|uniref:ATP-binding protein n=1 Tax=Streptomyces sp. NRRL WC-3742 TaxID=1463934 RepID=UPI0006922664|nr:hypothetical protein [Streptomyces sp. NRRL WC-3742]
MSSQIFRITCLPYLPESVEAAQRLVCAKLREWMLDDLVDDAALIVSELATNAITTGCQTRMVVAIRRPSCQIVRILVGDGSRVMPVTIQAGRDATSGRGLGGYEPCDLPSDDRRWFEEAYSDVALATQVNDGDIWPSSAPSIVIRKLRDLDLRPPPGAVRPGPSPSRPSAESPGPGSSRPSPAESSSPHGTAR